jgi:transcription elongation GreA/GreB family factor
MPGSPQLVFKMKLKERCMRLIQDRMDSLRIAMNLAQDAANEETKSSAGDKYETSRAMGQLEKDMYARQLAETGKEMASLMSVDCSLIYTSISQGSFVRCENICYFILAGIGKIDFNGELVYVISPNAPVSKSLLGKLKDDFVIINKDKHQIKEIF